MDCRERLFLRALRSIGVLEALVESADTAEDLAAETPLEVSVAGSVLETLVDLGYLTTVDDRLEPTRALLGILTTTDVRSVGTLPASLDAVDRLVALDETLAGEPPPRADAAALVHELAATAAGDPRENEAVATLAIKAAPTADEVVVLGGAPGRLAVEFAERGYTVTLMDHPTAIDRSEAVLAGTSVTTVGTTEWAELPTAELVVTAPGLRAVPQPRAPLLAGTVDAVDPSGRAVLVDRFHEPGAGDPRQRVTDLATLGRAPDRSLPGLETELSALNLTIVATQEVSGTDLTGVTIEQSRD